MTSDDPTAEPTLPRRLAERFALIAFGLYHVPLFVNNYPSLGGGGFNDTGLAVQWGHLFTVPGIWLARHLFGMTGPMTAASAGDNGDTGEEWARLILSVAIGIVVAAMWTMADRRKPRAPWVEGALRVLLRYSIALGILSYGIAKLLPQQFPALNSFNYETRVGELAPMRVLWHFMQYSRPYNFFAGVMEVAAVVLLCFRRTATAGAITAAAVMTNVALMNWLYDVPVKLYATMVLLSAIVLVIYDLPRLVSVFITNRGVAPARQPTLFEARIPEWARWSVKGVLVGSVALSSVVAMWPAVERASAPAPGGAAGSWAVTSFSRQGPAHDTSASATPWRRIIVNPGGIAVRLETERLMQCGRSRGADSTIYVLTCSRGRKAELHWTLASDTLRLAGNFDGAPLMVEARRLGERDYPLMRGGLHLIFDRQ